MTVVQVPVPPHPPPLQPTKIEPAAAAAVSVTELFVGNEALQVFPQLMPAGLLVTAPAPAPTSECRSGRRCRGQCHRSPTGKIETTGGSASDTRRAARYRSEPHALLSHCEGERIESCEARRDRLVGVHHDGTSTSPAAACTAPASERRARVGRGGQCNNAVDWKISLTGRPARNATGTTGHRTVSGLIDR